ncbi:MAG: S41 family peptidase [Crocinitomicaceae bacterium]
MKEYKFLWPVLMAGIFAAGLYIGTKFLPNNAITSNGLSTTESKLSTILDLIDYKYVDSVDYNFLLESSIEGMIQKLDPHSQYIPPKDLASVNEQLDGQFGGIGIRFLIHQDTLVVTHVLPNSPSKVAGLQPGDRVLQVGDSILADLKLDNSKVMAMLKGKPNTQVRLKVLRSGDVLPISINRGLISVNSITANIMLNNEVGFIKLSSFTANCAKEFVEAASELKAQGMRKLIFDLRNNGGGFLDAAKIIVDQFLTAKKLIVYTEGRRTGRKDYMSTSTGLLQDVEVIVLINSLSASASEIVAGAIQDNDRGYILGRRSFGKGLVQDQQEFNDGSALRLTISRYYTPTGRSIQKPYGDGVDYDNDYYNRYESGEMFSEDSIKVNDSLLFITPKGRKVYGGGGIYPDVFVPNDTVGASYYLTSLYYGSAFNQWVFGFLDGKRTKWNSFSQFNDSFRVTDKMFDDFISYAENKLEIKKRPTDIDRSELIIRNRIKAEVARHLFEENGYYQIYLKDDMDIREALRAFEKKISNL